MAVLSYPSGWLCLCKNVGVVGAAAAAVGACYCALKRYLIVKVNCWFCNADSLTYRHNRDSWYCPECGQYNGFAADGDYNREVPGQRVVEGTADVEPRTVGPLRGAGAALCPQCNFNQTLKIEALRNFCPVIEANYDVELRDFKEAVERNYRLCRKCENRVHQVLGKQDSSLRRNLVQLWKQRAGSALGLASSPRPMNGGVHAPPPPSPTRELATVAKICLAAFLVLLAAFPDGKAATKKALDAGAGLVLGGVDVRPFSAVFFDWVDVVYAVACFVWAGAGGGGNLWVRRLQLALCLVMVLAHVAAPSWAPPAVVASLLFVACGLEFVAPALFSRFSKVQPKVEFKKIPVNGNRQLNGDHPVNRTPKMFPTSANTSTSSRLTSMTLTSRFVDDDDDDGGSVEEMEVCYDPGVEKAMNGLHELHIGDALGSSARSLANGDGYSAVRRRPRIMMDSDRDFSPFPSPFSTRTVRHFPLRSPRFGIAAFGGVRSAASAAAFSSSFSQPSSPAPSLFGDGDNGSVFSEPCRPLEFRPPSPADFNSTFLDRGGSDDGGDGSPSVTAAAAEDVVSTASQTEWSYSGSDTSSTRTPPAPCGPTARMLGFFTTTSLLINFFLVVLLLAHEHVISAYRRFFTADVYN